MCDIRFLLRYGIKYVIIVFSTEYIGSNISTVCRIKIYLYTHETIKYTSRSWADVHAHTIAKETAFVEYGSRSGEYGYVDYIITRIFIIREATAPSSAHSKLNIYIHDKAYI